MDERRNPSAEVSIVTEEPTHDEPVEDEEDVSPIAGIGTLVFGKWDASEVVCSDPGLAPYINLRTVGVPHTGGRHANAWFGKSKLSVVERYINKLMRTGKYTGKKQGATKAFEAALDRIHDRTSSNPLQVFVDAIVHVYSDGGDHAHSIRRSQPAQGRGCLTEPTPRHRPAQPREGCSTRDGQIQAIP